MANSTQHGGEGKDLKSEGGGLFSTEGKSYKGPENWTPENKGTKNPDDVQKKDPAVSTTEVYEGGLKK